MKFKALATVTFSKTEVIKPGDTVEVEFFTEKGEVKFKDIPHYFPLELLRVAFK